jgi:hypothetical protein
MWALFHNKANIIRIKIKTIQIKNKIKLPIRTKNYKVNKVTKFIKTTLYKLLKKRRNLTIKCNKKIYSI